MAESKRRARKRISALKKLIKANQRLIVKQTLELAKLTGEGLPVRRKKRRGGKTARELILAILSKGDATSAQIVKKTKLSAGSINQALQLLKKSGEIKQKGKKGSPYSIK